MVVGGQVDCLPVVERLLSNGSPMKRVPDHEKYPVSGDRAQGSGLAGRPVKTALGRTQDRPEDGRIQLHTAGKRSFPG